jgi:hypothetical protein
MFKCQVCESNFSILYNFKQHIIKHLDTLINKKATKELSRVIQLFNANSALLSDIKEFLNYTNMVTRLATCNNVSVRNYFNETASNILQFLMPAGIANFEPDGEVVQEKLMDLFQILAPDGEIFGDQLPSTSSIMAPTAQDKIIQETICPPSEKYFPNSVNNNIFFYDEQAPIIDYILDGLNLAMGFHHEAQPPPLIVVPPAEFVEQPPQEQELEVDQIIQLAEVQTADYVQQELAQNNQIHQLPDIQIINEHPEVDPIENEYFELFIVPHILQNEYPVNEYFEPQPPLIVVPHILQEEQQELEDHHHSPQTPPTFPQSNRRWYKSKKRGVTTIRIHTVEDIVENLRTDYRKIRRTTTKTFV